jgi:hypothetical protein
MLAVFIERAVDTPELDVPVASEAAEHIDICKREGLSTFVALAKVDPM